MYEISKMQREQLEVCRFKPSFASCDDPNSIRVVGKLEGRGL